MGRVGVGRGVRKVNLLPTVHILRSVIGKADRGRGRFGRFRAAGSRGGCPVLFIFPIQVIDNDEVFRR